MLSAAGGPGAPGEPCGDVADRALSAAVRTAAAGRPDAAEAIVSDALRRCPEEVRLLQGLAELHLGAGRVQEAARAAGRWVDVAPGEPAAWDLLAVTRYLRDDPAGALRAWGRGTPPIVREIDVRLGRPDTPLPAWASPDRVPGLTIGDPLDPDGFLRAARRLEALPAVARARLEFRLEGASEARVQASMLPGERTPWTRGQIPAHLLRGATGAAALDWSDVFGQGERASFEVEAEGRSRGVRAEIRVPVPVGGVWRVGAQQRRAVYASPDRDSPIRSDRTRVVTEWGDWIRGTAHLSGRVGWERRAEGGHFGGIGGAILLRSGGGRATWGGDLEGWTRFGGPPGNPRAIPEAVRFGRWGSTVVVSSSVSRGGTGPPGVHARLGVERVSRGAPPDLRPRSGSGRGVDFLLRATSDLDPGGAIRIDRETDQWLHGGIEVAHPVGLLGPATVSAAAFVDGLARFKGGGGNVAGPRMARGSLHLGGGVRVGLPATEGWVRVDGAVDPRDGRVRASFGWASTRGASGR